MSEVTPFDPYRSPSLPEGPYAGKPASGRPQLLTALCITCLVLGILGLMNSLFGTIGIIGGQRLQTAFQTKLPPNAPPGMQVAQDEFEQEMQEVQKKYWIENVISIGFRFTAALLLVIGSVKSLGKIERGRQLLLAACAVALIFELGHAILQSIVTAEIMTSVNGYMEAVFQSLPNRDKAKGLQNVMQTFTGAAVYAAVASIYILMAIKGGVYLFGLIYLRKPHIKEQFTMA